MITNKSSYHDDKAKKKKEPQIAYFCSVLATSHITANKQKVYFFSGKGHMLLQRHLGYKKPQLFTKYGIHVDFNKLIQHAFAR